MAEITLLSWRSHGYTDGRKCSRDDGIGHGKSYSMRSERAQSLKLCTGEVGADNQAQKGQNYNLNSTPAVFCGVWST